jgi:hypothetical protein
MRFECTKGVYSAYFVTSSQCRFGRGPHFYRWITSRHSVLSKAQENEVTKAQDAEADPEAWQNCQA